MKKILVYLGIIFGITAFFYLDRFRSPGSDVIYYFDIMRSVHQGGRFLIDFFDYRIPVFGWTFSWIYNFNFSDIYRRITVFSIIYSAYMILLFRVSLTISKSYLITILIIAMSFISFMYLDIGRDSFMPVFHHTLELISMMLILFRRQNWKIGALAGLLAGYCFMGRQIHFLPFFAMIIIPIIKKDIRHFALAFWISTLGVIVMIAIRFLSFNLDYMQLSYHWLWEVPKHFHNFHKPLTTGLLTGLLEFRNIKLPLFFFTYLCAGLYFLKYIFLKTKIIIPKRTLLITITCLTMYIINVQPTGTGAARLEAPLITIYSIFLSILLSNKNLYKEVADEGFVGTR